MLLWVEFTLVGWVAVEKMQHSTYIALFYFTQIDISYRDLTAGSSEERI
jgi:hypothetical protein